MHTLTNTHRDTKTSTTATDRSSRSVLRHLRQLIPQRSGVTYDEVLQVAERQATRLHALLATEDVTEADLLALPRLRVVREDIATSGLSYWNGQEWIICLNAGDSLTRQRFTLLHEFKHIVDHGSAPRLYGSQRSEAAERAADYFAGCALVPKRELKAAWGSGMQAPDLLAEHFGVSLHAMTVRLSQTGLSRVIDHEPTPRCARPIRTPRFHAQQFTPQRRLHAPA